MQDLWARCVRDITNYGVERLIQCVVKHVEVSIITFCICALIGIPLGIICAKKEKLGKIFLTLSNFMKVIPTLAIMLILLPYLGAGMQTAVIVLTVLGLPPILVNTCLGLKNVDSRTLEAAVGMGMTDREVLFKVQLPLAFPMMLTGLRTSGIQIVACATLAYYVGGGGLGAAIGYGLSMHLMPLLILASLLVALMTALLDLAFSFLQKRVDAKYSI